ncbi:hypothetical protein ACHAP6_001337 [Verticillium nonalfalfae]
MAVGIVFNLGNSYILVHTGLNALVGGAFFVNIGVIDLVIVAVLGLVFAAIPRELPRDAGRFDWAGAVSRRLSLGFGGQDWNFLVGRLVPAVGVRRQRIILIIFAARSIAQVWRGERARALSQRLVRVGLIDGK